MNLNDLRQGFGLIFRTKSTFQWTVEFQYGTNRRSKMLVGAVQSSFIAQFILYDITETLLSPPTWDFGTYLLWQFFPSILDIFTSALNWLYLKQVKNPFQD